MLGHASFVAPQVLSAFGGFHRPAGAVATGGRPHIYHSLSTPQPDEPKDKEDRRGGREAGSGRRRETARQDRSLPDQKGMPGAPCNVEPTGRRLRWSGLGRRRRRRLPVARLGGERAGRGRGVLRRLRLRWLRARWLRRAARRLAAIYMAALAGPPAPTGASSSTCPPWIGLEPCFATPFVSSTRPCW